MPENRAPDLLGAQLSAWHLKDSPEARGAHKREFGYEHTGVATWIINGPYHPHWSWWMLACIDLRDRPGMPPANKQYPAAEYELACYSLLTEELTPNIEAIEGGRMEEKERGFKTFLLPADFTFHFDGLTDEQAAQLTHDAAEHIVAGFSCDSDNRTYWLGLLANSVEHLKTGGHADARGETGGAG